MTGSVHPPTEFTTRWDDHSCCIPVPTPTMQCKCDIQIAKQIRRHYRGY